MAGLLDFAATPAGQGLLAAAFGGLAGARKDAPYNSLGKAGLAGLAGFTGASAVQTQQQNAAREQKKLDDADALKRALPGLFSAGADGSQKFDWKGATELGLDPKDIVAYAQIPNAGRSEVARTVDVTGPNGGKQTVQYDKYGAPVGQGIDAYVPPQLVDTGSSKQFVTPQAGQSFAVGMSPSQRDASNRGWANVDLRGQSNRIASETNDVLRGSKLEEQALKVDALKAAQNDRELARQTRSAGIASQIGVIDKALNHPGRATATGLSGSLDPRNYTAGTDARDFQVVADQLGGTAFLQAFESLKGGGQITEVEGKKATDAMARLNRAQSDSEYTVALEDLRKVMVDGQTRLNGGVVAPVQVESPGSSGFTADKEARYQAWKKAQGMN